MQKVYASLLFCFICFASWGQAIHPTLSFVAVQDTIYEKGHPRAKNLKLYAPILHKKFVTEIDIVSKGQYCKSFFRYIADYGNIQNDTILFFNNSNFPINLPEGRYDLAVWLKNTGPIANTGNPPGFGSTGNPDPENGPPLGIFPKSVYFKRFTPYTPPSASISPAYGYPGQTLQIKVTAPNHIYTKQLEIDLNPTASWTGSFDYVNAVVPASDNSFVTTITIPKNQPIGKYNWHIDADSCPYSYGGFEVKPLVAGVQQAIKVKGALFLDKDKNCTPSNGDVIEYASKVIEIKSGSSTEYALVSAYGTFATTLPTGDYTIKQVGATGGQKIRTCQPPALISIKDTTNWISKFNLPDSSISDIGITLTTTPIVQGRDFLVRAIVTSYTDATSLFSTKKTMLVFDPSIVEISDVNPNNSIIDSIVGEKIYFKDVLLPFEFAQNEFTVAFRTKAKKNFLNQPVAFTAHILNAADDFNDNDVAKTISVVKDKTPEAAISVFSDLSGNSKLGSLHVAIHFQNTKDTAYSVVVRDTLSPNLDIATLRGLQAPWGYVFKLLPGRVLEVSKTGSTTPDSTTDYFGSQGVVGYTIDPIATLQKGQSILHKASIAYNFDGKIVTTNQIETTYDALGTKPVVSLKTLNVFPNPTTGSVHIPLQREPIGRLFVISSSGQLHTLSYQFAQGNLTVDMSHLPIGLYTIRFEDGQSIGRVLIVR